MGVETENYEIPAKGFENTDFVVCILVVRVSSEILPVGYLKGRYKSESSLMTCVAELHCSVTRMPSSTLSLIGSSALFSALVFSRKLLIVQLLKFRPSNAFDRIFFAGLPKRF